MSRALDFLAYHVVMRTPLWVMETRIGRRLWMMILPYAGNHAYRPKARGEG